MNPFPIGAGPTHIIMYASDEEPIPRPGLHNGNKRSDDKKCWYISIAVIAIQQRGFMYHNERLCSSNIEYHRAPCSHGIAFHNLF